MHNIKLAIFCYHRFAFIRYLPILHICFRRCPFFSVATPVQAFINHQFGVAHSWKTAPPSARSELWLRGWRVLSPSRLLPPYGAAAWAWMLLSYPRHPWTDRWAASQRRTVLASSLLGCGISDTWHGARHRVWFEARATRCNNVWGCCPNG